MLPRRWCYGLIGTSLLGGAARAEPCGQLDRDVIALVLGVQVAPEVRLVGGIEGRHCVADNSEALLRIELGGGSPRVVAGVRARPLEHPDTNDGAELVGVEVGGVLDLHARFGAHLAATYGTEYAYVAAQARVNLSEPEDRTHWMLLGGLAPWTAFKPRVVAGRPIASGGRLVRPRVARELAAPTSREAAAVRAHFIGAAQLELSSVWAFLRLAGELATVGAPPALIAAALDAADDEVLHAALCARAAGGVTLAALPASLARPRFAARSPHALARLAAEAWCEGCLNESGAAEEARLAGEAATGEASAMLAAIARDEARHAELAWAVLAWLYDVAPDVAAAALAEVPPPTPTIARVDPALARHGVPTADVSAAAHAHAVATARRRLD